MTNANKKLEILIGDDLFGDPIVSISINRSLESLKEIYKLTYAINPQEVLQEALTGKYDIIATDLDYGTTGRVGTEGYEIIDTIAKMPLINKPFIILCTSQDNQSEEIQKRINKEMVNAVIGPSSYNKFLALKEYLIEYSKQRASAEGDKPLHKKGGEKE